MGSASPRGASSADLVPALYEDLRRRARDLLRRVPPGNTLQPTALIHEAYLRLSDGPKRSWDGRGHFFAAAAEAMRQILVEQARRKASLKRGGGRRREIDFDEPVALPPSVDVLALDEAVERLARDDPRKARIVVLRYFGGLTREETAEALGMALRTLDREWRYVVARLHRELSDGTRARGRGGAGTT